MTPTRYLPIHLVASQLRFLIVGGGAVGERRALSLLEAGAGFVQVVSRSATERLHALACSGDIQYLERDYGSDVLKSIDLVFAATNERTTNSRIAIDARRLGKRVCVSDDFEEGDFILPSIVRSGRLCIGVSTGGSSPTLSKRIAQDIGARYDSTFAHYVELLSELRDLVQAETSDARARKRALAAVIDNEAEIVAQLRDGDADAARAMALACARAAVSSSLDLSQ